MPSASWSTTSASGPLDRPIRLVASRPSMATIGSPVISGIGRPPRFPVLPFPHDIECGTRVRPDVGAAALVACTSSQATTTSAPTWPSPVDALPTMDPTAFHDLIAQQKGHPVLVNIWASWCGPCITEAPDLAAAHAKYGGTVRFIGVDAQDDRSGATTFIHEHQLAYPSVFDSS